MMLDSLALPTFRRFPLVLLLLAGCMTLPVSNRLAAADSVIQDVTVGFGDSFKIGHWAPVTISVAGDVAKQVDRVDLLTKDSDGVTVVYSSSQAPESTGQDVYEFTSRVKFGQPKPELVVELFAGNKRIALRKFPSHQLGRALVSTDELIVTFGDDVGVTEAIRNHLRSDDQAFHGATVEQLDRLPTHWQALGTVDTLILTTADLASINRLGQRQLNPLAEWVRSGGHLLLCVGANGQRVFSDPHPLAVFRPGKFIEVRSQRRVSTIEDLVRASQPLPPFALTLLEEIDGRVDLVASRSEGDRPALVVRHPEGSGMVTVVTADLDQAPWKEWPHRAMLLATILSDSLQGHANVSRSNQVGQVSHVGYNDLIGQLRGSLDRFPGNRLVNFSLVAGLIVLYALLIGPADFFFVRRVLGRSVWSWATFSMLVLGFAAIAVFLYQQTKDSQLRINALTITDIDVKTNTGRSTSWAHLLSPITQSLDVSYAVNSSIPTEDARLALSWQGLPGTGLGGLDASSGGSLFKQPYAIDLGSGGTIRQLPIQNSCTKSLVARWQGGIPLEDSPQLAEDRNGLLAGQINNPLDMKLSEAVLIYNNWAYPFRRSIFPGDVISIDELTPKNLEWLLQRRRVVEMEDRARPWDETQVDDLKRIAQMIMFHAAAGGKTYTRLTHDYQADIDLSRHLLAERAVLLAETDWEPGHWLANDTALQNQDQQNVSYVRIIFPVEATNKN